MMKNYKNYVIQTDEGTQKGLFFRSPIQKISFDTYSDEVRFSAWDYLAKTKKPIFRIIQTILGNGEILKNINEWADDCDWGEFSANILCFPIYFKRNFRSLKAFSQDTNENIQAIESYGYESEFETCSGGCEIEKTVFKMKNGKKTKEIKKDKYEYTYSFKIEELIDGKLA